MQVAVCATGGTLGQRIVVQVAVCATGGITGSEDSYRMCVRERERF